MNLTLSSRTAAAAHPLGNLPTQGAWIQPLGQAGDTDCTRIGAKAARLGTLLGAGFPVPPGFCLTVEAYRHAHPAAGAPGGHALPSDLALAILAAYRRLREETGCSRVAVRSSALEEDGAKASWAGIFTSVLGVGDESALLAAVLRCYQALHGETAAGYRASVHEAGTSKTAAAEPTMGVIVQAMVPATASGVVYTCNPLTGDRAEICINSLRGLAEPLADGTLNGDRFILGRDLRMRAQTLSPQPFRLTSSGVQSVPFEQQVQPSLSLTQCRQLAQTALALAKLAGGERDIEFAFAEQQLWIVQDRPIVPPPSRVQDGAQRLQAPLTGTRTTPALDRYLIREHGRLNRRLQRLQAQGILRHGPGLLSNSNIGELLPSPTPMSFALFVALFAGPGGAIPRGRRHLGYHLDDNATEHLFCLVGGQPYFHLELDARTFAHGQPLDIPDLLAQVRKDPARASYPEFGLYPQADASDENAADTRHYERMRQRADAYLPRYRRRTEPHLKRYLARQRRIDCSHLSGEQLVGRIQRLIRHLRRYSCLHFVIAARLGFYFAERVRCQLHQLVPDLATEHFALLLQGLPGSRITEQLFALERMQRGECSESAYLDDYGHLALNELELREPRFYETAGAASGHLPAFDGHALGHFLTQARRRKRAERALRVALENTQASPQEVARLFADLRQARRYLPLRETIKYYYAGEYALIRQALLALQARLGYPDECIFYLRPEELPRTQASPQAMLQRARVRQREHRLVRESSRECPLPDLIDPQTPTLASQATAPRRQGTPIAPGKARGVLHVLDDQPREINELLSQLGENAIIVTRSANLGLAPLMRKIAGIVVETGGVLSHCACQAREAGIPALVLPNATRFLAQGAQAVLDGETGLLLSP